ncbi:PepSY domain-containing protein [Carnobacterium pleistocenium]|uniref:PepSY domain-containing protein n=1 Tax=Carnobacterium pleistocenium TaxID=181073 RepID=UPI000551C6FF|nr:PepSY domain-containing protein [Carnobacterium pleistocenium]
MYKKAALYLTALFSLGLLSACGTNEEDSSLSSTASSVTSSTVSSETAQNSDATENVGSPLGINPVVFNTSFGTAISMYFDTFPDSYIESVAMEENDDGRYEYKIDGFDSENEYDLTIYADNGSILKQNQEQNENGDQTKLILEDLIT